MAGVGSVSGSQIDVQGMVSQLMAVERRPISALQTDSRRLESKISALGSIKSKVAAFQEAAAVLSRPETLRSISATTGDGAGFKVSTLTSARSGEHQVQVMQLAQPQKLVTTGQTSAQAPIGTGTVVLGLGSGEARTTAEITIGSGNNSLRGIQDAINSAGLGIQATIIQDGSTAPHRLVLTTTATGQSQQIDIQVTGDEALRTLLEHQPNEVGGRTLQQTLSPQNAVVNIDGLAIQSTGNTLAGAIEGVTITATAVDSTPKALSISPNSSALEEKLSALVSTYNDLTQSIRSSTSYDLNSRSGAVLYGESGLRNMLTQVRTLMASPTSNPGKLSRISQLGVEFQKDGTLALNATKLADVLATQPADVEYLLTAKGAASDAGLEFSRFSDAAKTGSHSVVVTQLPSAGKIEGASPAFPAVLVSGVNDQLELVAGGASIGLDLGSFTAMDVDSLATQLRSSLDAALRISSPAVQAAFAGVTVAASANGGLLLALSQPGATSTLRVSGSAAMNLFGSSPTITDGADVAGSIGGVTAVGVGRTLTAASDSAAAGISLRVVGGTVGARGTVVFSRGLGDQLQRMLDSYLDESGPMESRTEGLRSSISRIEDRIERLEDRLVKLQKQYTRQFTALDVTLSTLNTTSNALGQQLNSLSANQTDN